MCLPVYLTNRMARNNANYVFLRPSFPFFPTIHPTENIHSRLPYFKVISVHLNCLVTWSGLLLGQLLYFTWIRIIWVIIPSSFSIWSLGVETTCDLSGNSSGTQVLGQDRAESSEIWPAWVLVLALPLTSLGTSLNLSKSWFLHV